MRTCGSGAALKAGRQRSCTTPGPYSPVVAVDYFDVFVKKAFRESLRAEAFFKKQAVQRSRAFGRVAEWSIATVLKTVEPRGSVGSNPTPSATALSQESAKHSQALRATASSAGRSRKPLGISNMPQRFRKKARNAPKLSGRQRLPQEDRESPRGFEHAPRSKRSAFTGKRETLRTSERGRPRRRASGATPPGYSA